MLLFIIALLVAGGVIAYVGDRLGTYIGKKRLTAWGLRPRHTAMLYTVLSGGLIAVLTLFALIGYDRTVQRALLYGPQLLQENYQLKRENRVDRQQVIRLDRQTLLATQQTSAAQQQTSAARSQAASVSKRLSAAKMRLRKSRNELQSRQAMLVAARLHLASLHSDLHATHADLAAAQLRLNSAAEAYGKARRNVIIARHQVNFARRQYAQELDTVNHIAEEGAQLTRQNTQLAAHNAELTQENAALDIKNQDLLNQTSYLQGAHLIYHKGQEIGRVVIPTSLTAAETRQRLDQFLRTLSDQAQQNGASSGANGLAVRVFASAQGTPVDEQDALAALAQSIAGEPDSTPGVVVVAVAGYNAFGGEQTPIELQPYDNVLVYSRGALIAQTTIDGTLPENEILNALGDFLKQQVQPDARDRGIIPRPDPETGEPTVGEPTDDKKTYALVKQIQRIGAHAVVTARAAADTYSSGPLRLDLSAAPAIPVVAPPASAPSAAAPRASTAGG